VLSPLPACKSLHWLLNSFESVSPASRYRQRAERLTNIFGSIVHGLVFGEPHSMLVPLSLDSHFASCLRICTYSVPGGAGGELSEGSSGGIGDGGGTGSPGAGIQTSEGTGIGIGTDGAGAGTADGDGVGIGPDGAAGSTSEGENFTASSEGVSTSGPDEDESAAPASTSGTAKGTTASEGTSDGALIRLHVESLDILVMRCDACAVDVDAVPHAVTHAAPP
jgi:hypothetical protein